MRNKLIQFMYGRYGNDKLNTHALVLSVVLSIINMFVRSPILYVLDYILLLAILYRMLSRNINKRYNENMKYHNMISPFTRYFNMKKKEKADPTHKYYMCPTCKQIVRVPKGRGRIDIRCPRCNRVFEKRT